MAALPTSVDVELSFKVLVGTQSQHTEADLAAGLDTLTPSELKRLFRQRALACHPDRATTLQDRDETLKEQFRELRRAYEVVLAHLLSEARASSPSVHRGNSRENRREGIPRQRLHLAQYLFFVGAISRDCLQAAVAWQQRQRPLFGELAIEHRRLCRSELAYVLVDKLPGERIGEASVRTRRMTPFERDHVLRQQRRRERPFEDFFMTRGIMTAGGLARFVLEHREHNRRCDADASRVGLMGL